MTEKDKLTGCHFHNYSYSLILLLFPLKLIYGASLFLEMYFVCVCVHAHVRMCYSSYIVIVFHCGRAVYCTYVVPFRIFKECLIVSYKVFRCIFYIFCVFFEVLNVPSLCIICHG